MNAKLSSKLIEAEAAANRAFDDTVRAASEYRSATCLSAQKQYEIAYHNAEIERRRALDKARKDLEAAAKKIVDLAQVSSVYSGKDNHCCCGCAGKHTYASAHVKWAGRDRGYAVTPDEVNDRTVKLIVNKINLCYAGLVEGGRKDIQETDFISAVVGDRLYIAYLKH